MLRAEQLINFAAGPARRLFDASGQIYRPIFHLICENGEHVVFRIPNALDDKNEWMIFARGVMHAAHAVAYVMIYESWMLTTTVKNRAEIEVINKQGLEKQPGRTEVVLLMAEDEMGELQGLMPITRTEGGKPILGALEILPRDYSSEGRFVGLLPSKKLNS